MARPRRLTLEDSATEHAETSSKRFQFLRLPSEIRNRIYSFILDGRDPTISIYCKVCHLHASRDCRGPLVGTRKQDANEQRTVSYPSVVSVIARLCRQTRNEYHGLYHARSVFRLFCHCEQSMATPWAEHAKAHRHDLHDVHVHLQGFSFWVWTSADHTHVKGVECLGRRRLFGLRAELIKDKLIEEK